MNEAFGASALWAMHPAAMDRLLSRASFDAMLPESLKALASLGRASPAGRTAPTRQGLATVINLSGPLSPKGSYGGTSTERFADDVHEAAVDTRIGVIILAVASPGGMVFGTAEAADAVYAARRAKPVIAVASPYAFSAAHWIACQASAYYVSTSGQVGSAGVRAGHIDMSGLEAKLGMKTTLIASSREKIAGHPYAPLADDDRAEIQRAIDESNRAFVAAIARGRRLSERDVTRIHGAGRTFSAKRAAAERVVDGVSTLQAVIDAYAHGKRRLDLLRQRDASCAGPHPEHD